MLWPDEIRPATGLAPSEKVTVRPQELKMAESLMETLSEDFDLAAQHDEYQHALDELVAAKLEGEPIPEMAETAAAPDNVVDLMAALQASIDARAPAPAATAAPAAKKAAAPKKKAAAKKTAARKKAG
jgi:DNA end-binding protein Ku